MEIFAGQHIIDETLCVNLSKLSTVGNICWTPHYI